MQKSVIVFQSYCVVDSCEDGIDCLTYEYGNASDVVARLEMRSEDPGLAKRITSKTRCDGPAKFNERNMARAIDGFIAEVSHEESDNRQ